jgi:hypothetical protein
MAVNMGRNTRNLAQSLNKAQLSRARKSEKAHHSADAPASSGAGMAFVPLSSGAQAARAMAARAVALHTED